MYIFYVVLLLLCLVFQCPSFLYIFIYSYAINAHFYAPHASYHSHANIRLQPNHQYFVKTRRNEVIFFYVCIYNILSLLIIPCELNICFKRSAYMFIPGGKYRTPLKPLHHRNGLRMWWILIHETTIDSPGK